MSRIRSIRHLGRLILLTAGVPLVFLAISLALISSWSDRLPRRVATHWGSGGVDGTGTLVAGLVVPLVVVVGVLALLFTVIGLWSGRAAAGRRLAAGFGVGVTALICSLILILTHGQLGLDDAMHAPSPTLLQMLLGVSIALVAGTAAALLAGSDPAQPAAGPVDPSAPRTELAQGESAMWTGVAASVPMLWLGIVLTGALVLVSVLNGSAVAAPVGIVSGLLVVGSSYWRVTVDRRGLRCVGVFGVPRLSVPLDEVESAHETQVHAFRDYGGYGLRMGRGGRPGVILRKGSALEVRRTGGRGLVVTIAGAQEAAALLNTLAERRVSG